MPDVATDSLYRVVIDEASLQFFEIAPEEISDAIREFCIELQDVRGSGHTPAISSLYTDLDAMPGIPLIDLLTDPRHGMEADARRLCLTLLDRCPKWDEDVSCPSLEVQISGRLSLSPSVGYAHLMALSGRNVACLVCPVTDRRGYLLVKTHNHSAAKVFFFACRSELPIFWRGIFHAEDVNEESFFSLARHAFPDLILHPELDFRRFAGRYRDLRDRVVSTLAALNDRLEEVVRERRGMPTDIAAALGGLGVDVSPESPNTRGSRKLMRHREVEYEGRTYVCEWHAKLERHRNRVHFTLPSDGPDGLALIGLFVDHLPT